MSDDTRERSRHAARDASAPPNGPDGNQTMMQPDGHLAVEMVSAWLDAPDDFNEPDRLAIENHLAGCAHCTQVAAELTAIVRAFQALPFVDVPRSFALTPEMAGLTATPTLPAATRLEEPANLHERKLERESRKPVELYEQAPWYERQMSALRWTTAVAAMLFVFLISADVLGNIDTGGDDDDDSAPMSEAAPASTQASAAGASAATDTTSAVMVAPEEDEQDGERNSEAELTPAGATGDDATGNAPVPTVALGAADATAATTGEAEDEELPASGGAEATAEQADTMMAEEPTVSEQADQAQQDDDSFAGDSSEDPTGESRESNTLHLIELALVILIAWLIVAMIALPRLRRPFQ